MDLKMRQALVQSCGTISAFNYAYCKTIYHKAFLMLESDVIDSNGEPFPIVDLTIGQKPSFKKWEKEYQERLEDTEEAMSSFDSDFNEKQEKEKGVSDYRKICNASCIVIKKESLLPVLVEHLEEQTKIKSVICFSPSGYTDMEELRRFSNEVAMFFGQVKEFLAMFE